jgi:hypothetical protein
VQLLNSQVCDGTTNLVSSQPEFRDFSIMVVLMLTRLSLHIVDNCKPAPDEMDSQIALFPLISEDMVGDQSLVNQMERDSWKVIDGK